MKKYNHVSEIPTTILKEKLNNAYKLFNTKTILIPNVRRNITIIILYIEEEFLLRAAINIIKTHKP